MQQKDMKEITDEQLNDVNGGYYGQTKMTPFVTPQTPNPSVATPAQDEDYVPTASIR